MFSVTFFTDCMCMFSSALSGQNVFPTTKFPTYDWSNHKLPATLRACSSWTGKCFVVRKGRHQRVGVAATTHRPRISAMATAIILSIEICCSYQYCSVPGTSGEIQEVQQRRTAAARSGTAQHPPGLNSTTHGYGTSAGFVAAHFPRKCCPNWTGGSGTFQLGETADWYVN